MEVKSLKANTPKHSIGYPSLFILLACGVFPLRDPIG